MLVRVALLALLVAATAHGALYTKGGMVMPSPASEKIPGQHIVVFHANVSDEQVARHMSVHAAMGEVMHEYNMAGGAFRGYAAKFNEDQIMMVAADDAVEFVEADQTMHMQQSCERQIEATWNLARTNQRNLDLNGLYVYHTGIGEGVNVYVIDTGIYVDNVDFEGRAELGPTFVPGSTSSVDGNGHGTHVASIAIGKTWGLAKGATAVGVQVLGADGSGSNSGVIAGIDWCATDFETKKKANPKLPAWVANLSLGGGYSSATNRAVDALVKAGLAVAVAAGNDNRDACSYSPASASDVLSVGSTDSRDDRSFFSNYGRCVDILAPGSDISAAWIGKYATNTISGTSMASPGMAGIMAKIASTFTSYPGAQVQDAAISIATSGKLHDLNGSPDLLGFSDCS